MNFTREPIIETVITPKEGFKLVIRNSKGSGQEEFFVDAVEVISFGNTSFFRSLEKPKSFLVPVNDYEVLEVREARMVLKTATVSDKGIKIGRGREPSLKLPKEQVASSEASESTSLADQKADKRRERRRGRKKKASDSAQPPINSEEDGEGGEPAAEVKAEKVPSTHEERPKSLIPPPPTLISETLFRYKDVSLTEKDEGKKEEFIIPPPPELTREPNPGEEDPISS